MGEVARRNEKARTQSQKAGGDILGAKGQTQAVKSARYDFVGAMGALGIGSAALVFASWCMVAIFGLNLGIDFAGGYEVQVRFAKPTLESEIRKALMPLGLEGARVQRFGPAESNEFLIMTPAQGTLDASQKEALRANVASFAGGDDSLLRWDLSESGERLVVGFAEPVDADALRKTLQAAGLSIEAQTRGGREDKPEYTITLRSVADSIEEALRAAFSLPADAEVVSRVAFVGPQVGAQLRNQGILAVVYALIFVLLYIAVRFDLFFSPGAVVALIHDVSLVLGIFAVFQLEFNLPIVAAILALVGYSLNDTLVIYDRIRENLQRFRGRPVGETVNLALNQTLSRTVLTSVTTLLVVAALLFFGGDIIRDFSIALFIGVIVGTYSSIAIATPVYIFLRQRSEQASSSKVVSNPAVRKAA